MHQHVFFTKAVPCEFSSATSVLQPSISPPTCRCRTYDPLHFNGGPLPEIKKPIVTVEPLSLQIKQALSGLGRSRNVHGGGAFSLPHPGLRVIGMPEPVGLPLQSYQAEQLASIAQHPLHNRSLQSLCNSTAWSCLKLDASQIACENKP